MTATKIQRAAYFKLEDSIYSQKQVFQGQPAYAP